MIQVCEVDHPYPPTKVMWSPHHFQNTVPTDHIATSADYLRIWSVTDEGIALRAVVYTVRFLVLYPFDLIEIIL